MDGLNGGLVRFALFFCCFALIANAARAEVTPQPLPAYSNAESLRGDSSLGAVAFADSKSDMAGTGVAVGDRGALYRSTDQGETWTALPSPVDCRLHDVLWTGSRSVVVIGGAYDPLTQLSRGVVLVSRDAGASFRRIKDHNLPLLHNVRLSENRLLVADGDWSHSQLTSTFVSRDGGRSWQGSDNNAKEPRGPSPEIQNSKSQSAISFVRWQSITGSPAPVRDACRITAGQLCAVGDHGLILTSEDDGETWTARRGGGRHAAILFVAGDAQSASWSLLGSESLQWRHRCAMLVERPISGSLQIQTTNIQQPLGLLRQAAVMLGAASVDWYQGDDNLEEPTDLQARRWIAVHRPSVVVIDESVSSETRQAVLQSAASMGVTRVLLASQKEQGGSLLHQSALLPRIGLLAADLILDAQHLVAPERCKPASISLTRLYDSSSSRIGGGGESIMAGLTVNPSNQVVGIAKSITRHRLQVVQARSKQSKWIRSLTNRELTSSRVFETSLRQLMDQTAEEDQLRMIWSVLTRTRGTHFENLCLQEIADRFRNRSVGKWAAVRIDAHQNSAEQQFLRLTEVPRSEVVQAASVQAAAVALSPFQNLKPEFDQSIGSQIQQASAIIPVGVAKPEVIQASPVSGRIQSASNVDLQLDLHPAVMLSRLVDKPDSQAERSNDGTTGMTTNAPTATTMGDLRRISMQGTGDWKRLLASDARGSRSSHHGLPQRLVKRTGSPPRLDGKLDDPCWDHRTPNISLGDFQISLAFDQNYLYVAAVCPSDLIARDAGRRLTGHAARDQVLFDVDRLKLRFDTDGDLWTSHCVEITDTGRTRDAVGNDTRWQPTWYVDVDRKEQNITFELAIRRSDLAGAIDDSDSRWFVSAQIIRAGTEAIEPLFPQPNAWRPIRFAPPEIQQQALRPAGPVRLAPVEGLR